MLVAHFSIGYLFLLTLIQLSQPTCVLESDFGFKINCAFKKAGLFRVRNLGGIKAHASLGFSLGDELGFEQSLTNLDPSRRRSVSVKNGAPPNALIGTSRPTAKQEKRGKQNRIMMRPQMPPSSHPNPSAMQALSHLHRRASTTMQPIVVDMDTPRIMTKPVPKVTLAKPVPMGLPPFKPLPPKEDTLKVLPIAATTKKTYTPLQLPQSKGPGLAYQSENQYPRISHDQVSKMVSQMTASHINRPSYVHFSPTPFIVENFTPRITMTSQIPYFHTYPTTVRVNPFVPMPVAAPPTQAAISIIPAPVFKDSVQIPLAPSMISKYPTAYSLAQNTMSIHRAPASEPPNPISNFVDPVPHHVNDLANQLYPVYSTKKVDDYNSITGYGDDVALNLNKDDINEKIAEIAKIGNISMEAIEAAIALRQQQLLTKFSSIAVPPSPKTTTTTTTEAPVMFQSEPEMTYAPVTQKQKRYPTSGKVMNAPKEYYPVGYEKNFDDQFHSKVDLPDTTFHCGDQKYFPGLYGDENLGCMVFHVCALTDDGLVMKSFLCPESTLFDQTILKCNWWFYVDCKNTRKLYDTNIPVSKSYQLMKALTFFSSYKKDMQEGGNETKPEEMDGIKEAISILENHNPNAPNNNNQNGVQIVTPQTPVYNKDSNEFRINVDSMENHRSNRNFKNITRTTPKSNRLYNNNKTNNEDMETSNSNIKLVNVNSTQSRTSTESSSREVTSKERRYRRRQIKQSERRTTTVKPMTTTPTTSTTTETTTTVKFNFPIIEAETVNRLRGEIVSTTEKSLTTETSTTETVNKLFSKDEKIEKIDASILKEAELSPSIKRFYRSSAESNSKEMAYLRNERVQIVRSKPYSRFVGESPTPTAAIARLDDAILGKIRRKKDTQITIIRPQKSKDSKEILSST